MLFLAATLALACAAHAAEFHFATPAEGAAVLTADDDFMTALSPADPALRLRSATKQSVAALKQSYASHVVDWNETRRAKITAVLQRLQPQLDALSRWLPARVDFVLVSAEVEGGLPHTRAAAIILPAAFVESGEPLDFVTMHELFHVLSRNNRAQRDGMYALIGFEPCHVIEPAQFATRRVTNPDAPSLGYFLPLEGDGHEGLVPYVYADKPVFDAAAGADFEHQLRVGFLHMRVQATANGPECVVAPGERNPMLPLTAHREWVERQTGANTGYLIHPEEALADNFALLIVGSDRPVPSPWVLERLRVWLDIPQELLPAVARH